MLMLYSYVQFGTSLLHIRIAFPMCNLRLSGSAVADDFQVVSGAVVGGVWSGSMLHGQDQPHDHKR